MKLFKLEIGNIVAYAAGESDEDMYKRRADVDPTFAFLPVDISEVVLDGYEITVTPLEGAEESAQTRNRGGRPKKIAQEAG